MVAMWGSSVGNKRVKQVQSLRIEVKSDAEMH